MAAICQPRVMRQRTLAVCWLAAAAGAAPVAVQDAPCPEGVFSIGLNVSATARVSGQWTSYSAGMILACFYVQDGSTDSAIVEYCPNGFPCVPPPAVDALRDIHYPDECSPNRFPKHPFRVPAGGSCRELPPYCSASLGLNFHFRITSSAGGGAGDNEVIIPIDCRAGGPAGSSPEQKQVGTKRSNLP